MPSPDVQRLEHIIDYCEDIKDSLERFGANLDSFLADRDFYNSISMSLLQIGELAKGLSDEVLSDKNSEVSWRAMVGMRNHFAHGYGEMDPEIIFSTAVNNIPTLKHQLEKYLQDFTC
jgi:uncharacterized protein with HEPN domain